MASKPVLASLLLEQLPNKVKVDCTNYEAIFYCWYQILALVVDFPELPQYFCTIKIQNLCLHMCDISRCAYTHDYNPV